MPSITLSLSGMRFINSLAYKVIYVARVVVVSAVVVSVIVNTYRWLYWLGSVTDNMSTTAFSQYPYSMPTLGYHSPLDNGVSSKLSPYQINSLTGGGFSQTNSPMDIMHQAINPYGQQSSAAYHNGM